MSTFTCRGINLVEDIPEVVVGVRALRDQLVERYPQIDVYLSGMVMMNNTFAEASLNDSATLVPLMFLAVILLIGILIRTIGGLVATLVIIIASIAGAMGLAGWYGLFPDRTIRFGAYHYFDPGGRGLCPYPDHLLPRDALRG